MHFAVILLAALLATAMAESRESFARSIAIDDFDVAIDLDDGGTLAITETIRLRFTGQWNGIHRLVPVEYRAPTGDRFFLRFTFEGVTNEAGVPLKVSRSREGPHEDLKIFIPGAVDTVQTIVVRYRIGRGVRFFPDHDELFWNVTGDEWPYPIRAARARMTLPRDLINVRANGFTGAYGATERAVTIRIDGERHGPADTFDPAVESPPPPAERHVVEIKADRPLGIREGLTIAVAWNPGVIPRPSAMTRWLDWIHDNLAGFLTAGVLIAVPLVTFSLLLRRWLRHGRDPVTGPVVVQYEPPAGLGPGEVGTLVDNRPDTRDLIAMLVDLAARRVIQIRETAAAGWFSKATYAFDLLLPANPANQRSQLSRTERLLLDGLFAEGHLVSGQTTPDGQPIVETVESGDLENRFHSQLPGIRSAIFERLVQDGHYAKRPDHVVSTHMAIAMIGAVLVVFFVAFAGVFVPSLRRGPMFFLTIVSAATSIFSVVGFGLIMPARTKRGADTRAAILGFEEFLSRVEAHRLATMPLTPELFERYLPYAMALGVEGRWARAFEGICNEPPRWYSGTGTVGTFHTANLTGGLSRMGAVTAAAMQSAPRSSGGSAFGGGGSSGGGGFSGGGFGGGGGHGF